MHIHYKSMSFCLVVFGLIVSLGIHLRYESIVQTKVVVPLRADAGEYFMYAHNLLYKHTYSREVGSVEDLTSPVAPDAARTPGYPLYLTLFLGKIGMPVANVLEKIQFSQAVLSSLTLLIAFICFQSFLPYGWSLPASLFVALSAHLIVANSYVLTESLFCFMLVSMACFVYFFAAKPSPWRSVLVGMAMGAACLVRPSLSYFPVAMALLLLPAHGRKNGLRLLGSIFLGFLITISPWIIRNTVTLHATGDNHLMVNFLHHGMYPNFTFETIKESYGFPYRFDPRSGEIGKSMSSVLHEIARRFEQEPVKHLIWFLFGKPIAFWSWDIVQGMGDAFVYPVSNTPYVSSQLFQLTHITMHALHWPLVILSLVGCTMAWLPLATVGLPRIAVFVARFSSLLLFYFTVMHMIGAPFPRYSIPLRPFMYGMAMFTPHLLLTALNVRRQGLKGVNS